MTETKYNIGDIVIHTDMDGRPEHAPVRIIELPVNPEGAYTVEYVRSPERFQTWSLGEVLIAAPKAVSNHEKFLRVKYRDTLTYGWIGGVLVTALAIVVLGYSGVFLFDRSRLVSLLLATLSCIVLALLFRAADWIRFTFK